MSCSHLLCLSLLASCAWRQLVGATDASENASVQGATDVPETPLGTAGPDLGVAIMLMGSVAFMMAVFYLVNHSDKHIQRYTWKVINTTISIFSSVLIFQACDKNLNDILDLENKSVWFSFVVDAVHGAFWFVFGEAILYGVSVHVSRGDSWSPLTYIFPSVKQDANDEDEKKFLQKLFSTYGTLSAHITGFAAIEAFGTLQQNLVHHCGITATRMQQLVALATTIFAGFVIAIIMELAGFIRHKLFTFDGSEIDEYEHEENEQAKEVENDVLGITVSFLLVQVVRFVVNGELPDAEGEIEIEGSIHKYAPFRRALSLIAVGIIFAVLMVQKPPLRHKYKRLKEYLKIIWSSSFAWSTYFALHWLNMANLAHLTKGQPAMFTVMVALTSTMVAFGMIFLLEKIESDLRSARNKKHINSVILSLSILVGFAWERSFDVALDDIAVTASESFATGCPQGLIVLVLAFTLAGVVLPAWYMFILPSVFHLDQIIDNHDKTTDDHRESLKPTFALMRNVEHAYMKLEEPLRSSRSNQSRSPRSPQPIESLSLEIPGDQFRSLAMQYHNLASRVANFRNQRLTGRPFGQGMDASRCAKSLAQFETEATNMNHDLVHYRRLLEERRMQQDNLEIGLNRMRMELHNEYLQLWGSQVAAG